jgi:hypothetical protein
MTHTPGPWCVAFGARLEIHGPKDEIGWPKSIVWNAGLCTDKESQANARLIAAAPDMLEALENIILCCDADDSDSLANAVADALVIVAKIKEP